MAEVTVGERLFLEKESPYRNLFTDLKSLMYSISYLLWYMLMKEVLKRKN
jgi:hypothetical protein